MSGVSSVVQFIIDNNKEREYLHFQIGKADRESGGIWSRVRRIRNTYSDWKKLLADNKDAKIHYSFPLSAPSILRDPWFMRYALKKGYGRVVHVHGGLFLTAPKIPFILERILKWVFSWDVPFIVLSEGEKEILKSRFGAKRVEVLANCPYVPEGTYERSDLNHSNQREALVLGYLGRIEPNKGMGELLEALKKCRAEGMRFKVCFAGKEQREGEYLPRYEEALGEDFEYCGLVSGETKRKFLDSLDVFVMPTYFEGLPMSLLETMGCGVVPVVTNVGSIATVVKDGENGLFIKVKDVYSIVDALMKLDNDRSLLLQMKQKARKTIADNFSTERYVEKLNRIYDSI